MLEPQKSTVARKKASGLYHDVGLRIVKLLNLGLAALPFACCWVHYYAQRVVLSPSLLRSTAMIMLFALLYFFFGRIYDAFLISIKRISEMFFSQLLGILMADAVMFAVLWLMSSGFPNILPALLALAGQLLLSLLWSKYTHVWYFKHFSGQKTAVVYERECDEEKVLGRYGLGKKFSVQAVCTAEKCLQDEMQMLQGMEAVFLCGVHSHERNQILKFCVSQGICVYVIPRIGDIIMSGARTMHMFHLPVMRVGRYNPPPEFVLVKRLFDIISSAVVILVTSPLMLAVAIAVKVQDGGPVFYRQTRLTKEGREFQILNVRCMGIAGYSARNSCAIVA